MTLIYYNTVWLKNVKTHYVKLQIETVDIYAEKSGVIFQKTMPISPFIFLAIIISIPFLIIVTLWRLLSFLHHLIFGSATKPSAEETNEPVKNGYDHFANLPENKKRRMMVQKNN